jgi:hypothetical protein
MFDRFTYLADNLLKRRYLLEASLATEQVSWEDCESRREELVARVMIFEAGVGDPETIQMVLAAIPRHPLALRFTDDEFAALAKFLRDAIPLDAADLG